MRRCLLASFTACCAGCAQTDHPAGIADEQFIEVMVELRQAANVSGGDSIAFAADRDRILRERNLSEADLGEYVKAHSSDLQHFERVWEDVNERLRFEGPR
ncbi:MAG: hypothetical protein WD054_05705 [Gemmatimonadota bacterium]